jgi:phosphatidylglycerophosphate synthase
MLLTWDRYASRWTRLHGGADPGVGTRLAYRVGRTLARLGVRPAGVTALGLALSVLVPLTVRQSPAAPLYAALLVTLAAAADAIDGAVALVANRVTRLGYVYDSVADRLGEAAWLTALWLLGTPTWLAVLAGAVTWLHEYLRARATAAGMREVRLATVAGRPARAAITVTGLGLAGLAGLAARPLTVGTATLAGTVWLLFGLVGLGQLLVAVHVAFRHGSGEPEAR